ncbi:BlyB family putative holin accessory protein [Borrelia miyamotoi]|uniref:BlyB family putative holin accessory protein n=1 Tax=Borrelia miyamotoi TaxID=47466 RepID=A0AAQ2WXW6_9SPIR|nr:BlyB family putative holin accessory protein [Borrelia miyamotoi]AOW96402.1 hypothetical protein AXH25_04520 [Borrelia miyamotoi]QTL84119.1 hypothetical protein bmLB2001_001198 [Borrelia miyamotoi]WAZ85716.1 BlyB family putative holin accessory protein [Borrelia miyamotoi]WAZ91498.1 BlyB family putative holin accessory protein [Borrelia miyamotoi]WAZ92786.1 BlyB family putative holin accessory protein [Borrelia miyamotoi]
MLNKYNTDLGIIFLQNLMEFFGYSETQENETFEIGIKKAIDLYKYMNALYLSSIQNMEKNECRKIIFELETILNKIINLINAIKNESEPNLIEELRLERNNLMETKTKFLKEELAKLNKKGIIK